MYNMTLYVISCNENLGISHHKSILFGRRAHPRFQSYPSITPFACVSRPMGIWVFPRTLWETLPQWPRRSLYTTLYHSITAGMYNKIDPAIRSGIRAIAVTCLGVSECPRCETQHTRSYWDFMVSRVTYKRPWTPPRTKTTAQEWTVNVFFAFKPLLWLIPPLLLLRVCFGTYLQVQRWNLTTCLTLFNALSAEVHAVSPSSVGFLLVPFHFFGVA